MNKSTYMALALALVVLTGCSAVQTTQQGQQVVLSNEKPVFSCTQLGETAGSQGNWFTGDYTSNKNLMVGARNKLRNEAAAMGGNYVWVQNMSNAQAQNSLGTSNTTVIGTVYRCPQGATGYVTTPSTVATSPTSTTSGVARTTTPQPGVQTQPATAIQVVLAAQKVAKSQGCGEIAAAGSADRFSAQCGDHSLVIECNGDQCYPARTTR